MSDGTPALLSDGEYGGNAAARKYRAAFEAINSGRAPAFAAPGIFSKNAFSGHTYAPC